MSLAYKGNGNPSRRGWTATASVTIHDDGASPVENATVAGHWSGLTSDLDNGITNASGTVALNSDRINDTGTFTFTVDNVTGCQYNPSLNNETSDSIDNLSKTAAGGAENELTAIPSEFRLLQNHPNPFNPETEIRFQLPEANHVVLRVYDILGQEIRRLADKTYEAGYYSITWNAKDNAGSPVSSGIYLYQIQAGSFRQVKKMSLMR
jgi:hypothetical protein